MVDITIFELHLDGSEFTANAPWTGSEAEEEAAESEADESGSGGPPLGLFAVLGVVTLVTLALVVKKVRGGEDTDLESIEDDLD